MKVFVTGASGWIGSAVVTELLAHDHRVVGLARSDASARALSERGADVQRGDLDDLESLRAGASGVDAVIHLANKHDWAHPERSNRAERAAVQTFGDALAGSDRLLLVASGAAGLTPGVPATEADASPFHGPDSMRGGAENLALSFAERGVRPVAVRFAPTVHGTDDHGFVAAIVAAARERGVSSHVGQGVNRWAAVHRDDPARLVRLVLEAPTPPTVVHAVAEEGVATRDIAAAIGTRLGLGTTSVDPDAAVDHFGFVGQFFGYEMSASSTATRERLGWAPTGATLLDDIADGAYG